MTELIILMSYLFLDFLVVSKLIDVDWIHILSIDSYFSCKTVFF